MKKEKRGIVIWLCIFIIILIITVCVNVLGANTDDAIKNGIKISGGTEGKDWTYTNPGLLKVKSDNVTISGTANADLKIEGEGISQLSIQDLDQKNHKLYLFSTDAFTVNVLGDNELSWVSGWESVTICGKEQGAKLLLSSRASGEDLSIENVKVCAELFEAERDINIKGDSTIIAKKVSDEEDAAVDVRVRAGRYININLNPGGSITVKVDNGLLPFLAEKKMTLGKDNKILTPENGVVRGENTPYGPDCYFVFDEEGDWDSNVVIKNITKE